MKKLLLTILTTICTVAGFAQTYEWVETPIADLKSGDIVIIADKTSSVALPHTAVSKNPAATSVTISTDGKLTATAATIETLTFEIGVDGESYTFKAEGSTNYLCCKNDNAGVAVCAPSTTFTNAFTWDATNNKLKNTGQGRWVGAYNKQDWRCYTSATQANIKNTVTAFYKKTAGSGETKTPTSLTFSDTEVTYDMASGETFTAPTLTTDPADLTGIIYTSSDPTVATVNETTGAVTILAKGTTTITATFAETATHYGSNATYTLKVKDTTVVPGYFNFVDWAFPGAEDWSTSYATRTAAYTEATVTFASANKQNSTAVIADCPVTKNDPVTVVLTNTANDIESFSANFEQWGSKEKTVTLYTSADVVNFTATDITTSTFAFPTTTLEKGVKAIRFVFSDDDNQVGIADITIKEVKGQGKIPTNLTFSETEVTYIKASASPFVAPTLTTTPEGLTGITYNTSDPTVATVDNDGAVTILAVGTTTITATFTETDTHLGSTASYTLNVTKTPTSLTFSQTSVTFNKAGEDPFVAPTLTTDPEGLTGITYTSSDPAVATVNEDGDVSILAEGTTTITATFAENDEYLGSTASYTLTVTKSKGTVTAELNFVGWTFPGADSGWGGYNEETVTFPEAVVWFKSASKQGTGMSITDCPVTKGGDITVTLNGSGTSEILSFSAEFEQWASKPQTVTLWTSTDGENYTATTTTTSNFSFGKTTLDSGVKAIMFKFSSGSNQIGVRSITLEILSDTTPVSTVEAAPATDSRIYNLAGQRVSATKSGLYIINGRKVIIK